MTGLTFVTCVEDEADAAAAHLLVESLRAFGGAPGAGPVLVFSTARAAAAAVSSRDAEVVSLRTPASLRALPFGGVVAACAEAETRTPASSLVWVDPRVLVVRPPALLDLGDEADVAVRPVHVRNVGSPRDDPLDGYWRRVYDAVGLDDTGLTVESFVDGRRLRAYFNSHVVAVRPGLGLFRRRLEVVERLAADTAFMGGPYAESVRRVFLFQAVFAALVAATVAPGRIRILPADYAYPYNLHAEVAPDRRPAALDDLVCFAYEGRSLDPDAMGDVAVGEPLRGWLAARRGEVV